MSHLVLYFRYTPLVESCTVWIQYAFEEQVEKDRSKNTTCFTPLEVLKGVEVSHTRVGKTYHVIMKESNDLNEFLGMAIFCEDDPEMPC